MPTPDAPPAEGAPALVEPRAARRRAWQTAAQAFRVRFQRPERLSVTVWADAYRWLPSTSANPGKYDSTRAPYQREPMDVIGAAAELGVRRVVLMWASQVGKSLVLENAIGHAIHLRPRPIIVVQPKIDSAEAWSKERLTPMVRATPVLRERVREGRSRDGDTTLRFKQFPGGFIAIASGGSPAELAARSCARAFCDETDRYQPTPEGMGHDIVERRGGAIDDFVQALTSTPGDKETSVIEPAFLAGDQRYYHVPCPHCGHAQRLVWGSKTSPGGLQWERGRPESAWYRCEANGCRIEEKHKAAMLEQGAWVAHHPEGRYPSFHLNALYSPFGGTTWAILVDLWERAQGKPLELKVFVNTILAETWEEPGEVVEAHTLLGRLEPYPVDADGVECVPAGVRVLTGGVDVQENRLELRVWGWGRREESWLVRTDILVGDTETDAPWRELDRLLRDGFRTADGRTLRLRRLFVDAGYRSNRVYPWCRVRHREGVYAVKGVGGQGVPFLGRPSVVGEARALQYPVGVDAAKRSFLRSRLYATPPAEAAPEGAPAVGAPRVVHLPDWCTLEELEQLTAEKLVKRLVGGRAVEEWVKVRERNEALDCQNYAHAALHSLGLRTLIQLGILEGRRPDGAAPAGAPPAGVPPRAATEGPGVERAAPDADAEEGARVGDDVRDDVLDDPAPSPPARAPRPPDAATAAAVLAALRARAGLPGDPLRDPAAPPARPPRRGGYVHGWRG